MSLTVAEMAAQYCTTWIVKNGEHSANTKKYKPEAKRQNITVTWNLDDKLPLLTENSFPD